MDNLTTLLRVRDILNNKCHFISTPSVSIGKKGKTYNYGYNDGLYDSMEVVMDMIMEIAEFVSVCCGVKGISKIEKREGGGRCYTICSKCKKECKQEWREY